MNITIIKKNIKNIYLKILSKKEIILTVPLNYSDDLVNKILLEKKSWIENKLSLFEEKNPNLVYFFGNPLNIILTSSKEEKVILKDSNLYIYTKDIKNEFQHKNLINDWLIKNSLPIIEKLTNKYLSLTNLSINKITIKNTRSQWGSCNYNTKNISLSSKLIHYPKEFAEYVILHELSHLIYPHHQREFYDYIGQYMPDYKERIKIRKNKKYLCYIN